MDSSPVTVADFSVQAIVLGVLSRYFPGHGFIAEETSSVLRQDPPSLSAVSGVLSKVLCQEISEAELCAAIDLGTRGHGKHERGHWGRGGRTWVLDPIDGTKGFLRGEQFCVALVRLTCGGGGRGSSRHSHLACCLGLFAVAYVDRILRGAGEAVVSLRHVPYGVWSCVCSQCVAFCCGT